MEEFTRELNLLLQKYPELPEFSLTVRPRVTIDIKKPVSAVSVLSKSLLAPFAQQVSDPTLPPMPANLASIKAMSENMTQ